MVLMGVWFSSENFNCFKSGELHAVELKGTPHFIYSTRPRAAVARFYMADQFNYIHRVLYSEIIALYIYMRKRIYKVLRSYTKWKNPQCQLESFIIYKIAKKRLYTEILVK